MHKWKSFWFESNMFFDHVRNMSDWERLRSAYPKMSDDDLLNAKEATYDGHISLEERDTYPNYGFRIEHDGERTLRDFFNLNKMKLDECDHDVGYTFDYEGPSIFSQSRITDSIEYVKEMQEISKTDNYGIVFWNYCPKCGTKLVIPCSYEL